MRRCLEVVLHVLHWSWLFCGSDLLLMLTWLEFLPGYEQCKKMRTVLAELEGKTNECIGVATSV